MITSFEADPHFVKFPISHNDEDIQFVKLCRPIAMPLKEMRGEHILTMGYDNEQSLMAFQYVDKPHKINYVYPVKKEMFNTFVSEFNKGMTEKELTDFILAHFLVVEEPCMTYNKDHRPVENLKFQKA